MWKNTLTFYYYRCRGLIFIWRQKNLFIWFLCLVRMLLYYWMNELISFQSKCRELHTLCWVRIHGNFPFTFCLLSLAVTKKYWRSNAHKRTNVCVRTFTYRKEREKNVKFLFFVAAMFILHMLTPINKKTSWDQFYFRFSNF